MMMKADVLSGFKTIKVCTSYMYKEQNIEHFPYDIQEKNVKPIYKEFEGWDEDLTQKESFENLPKTLKEYISFIEKELNIPISIVSVGPDRKQTIFV
jgi:adenylosuccinate synthase